MDISDFLHLDVKGILPHYLIHKVIDSIIEGSKEVITQFNNDVKNELPKPKRGSIDLGFHQFYFETTENEIETHLEQALKDSFNWSKEVSFRDLQESKSILSTFIELDFYLTPRKLHFTEFEEVRKIKLFKAIDNSQRHLAILGGPGAGKTTIGKYLCISLLLKDEKLAGQFTFPLVIRLRDFNRYGKKIKFFNLIEILLSVLGLKITSSDSSLEMGVHLQKLKLKILSSVLDKLKLLIIIDGFDEIADHDFRRKIIYDLNDLCNSLLESKIIITSRASDFPYRIGNTTTYEICPLSDDQIKEFIFKWLDDDERAEKLLNQLNNSPFKDTAMRPLTLAHLCAIFERYNKIPEKPKSVYRKIVALLLEEWDAQRGIERISKYSDFEIDRKIEFLAKLAFELTSRYQKYNFSKSDLENGYRIMCAGFKLPPAEVFIVAGELESHNGLIIQSGNDNFEFAHKSIQEYLTAEYIKGLDEIPERISLLISIPNELAIAISLSSNQSSFLGNLILNRLKDDLMNTDFIIPFLTRLLAEKPDFTIDHKLALSFLWIYSTFMSIKNQPSIAPDRISYHISSPSNKSLEQLSYLINTFLNLTEVKRSIRLLKGYYFKEKEKVKIKESQEIHYHLNYAQKHSERELFPVKLLINSTAAQYFEEG